MITITIQQKIMVALDIADMTQAELAKKLGMSAPALSQRIKTGKFSDADFQSIAKALGAEYKSGFYFPGGEKVE